MRSEGPLECTPLNRLAALSIIIDDVDSVKSPEKYQDNVRTQKPYTRQSSDASIKKILEEAERRKNQFSKLIDEHDEVIENIKRIEQLEEHNSISKTTQPQVIKT